MTGKIHRSNIAMLAMAVTGKKCVHMHRNNARLRNVFEDYRMLFDDADLYNIRREDWRFDLSKMRIEHIDSGGCIQVVRVTEPREAQRLQGLRFDACNDEAIFDEYPALARSIHRPTLLETREARALYQLMKANGQDSERQNSSCTTPKLFGRSHTEAEAKASIDDLLEDEQPIGCVKETRVVDNGVEVEAQMYGSRGHGKARHFQDILSYWLLAAYPSVPVEMQEGEYFTHKGGEFPPEADISDLLE